MDYQPEPGYESDDCVQTPIPLCKAIVEHFKPTGGILEPCRGDGNFYSVLWSHACDHNSTVRSMYQPAYWQQHMVTLDWCEIKEGRSFYDFCGKVDWVVTNPPWGQLRDPRGKDTHPMSFMRKAMEVADNIALLLTLNHATGLKKRFRWMQELDINIKEIVLIDTPPKPWPQAGFQNCAVYWQRGYHGDSWKITDMRGKINYNGGDTDGSSSTHQSGD